jgi:hypothetical protein
MADDQNVRPLFPLRRRKDRKPMGGDMGYRKPVGAARRTSAEIQKAMVGAHQTPLEVIFDNVRYFSGRIAVYEKELMALGPNASRRARASLEKTIKDLRLTLNLCIRDALPYVHARTATKFVKEDAGMGGGKAPIIVYNDEDDKGI